MRGKVTRQILIIIVALFGISLFYANCQNANSGSAASLLACNDGLRTVFSNSYYVFTRKNCASCHYSANLRGKGFADPNLYTAFTDFQNLTELVVRTYALDPTHQVGITGTQNQAAIDSARGIWNAGELTYTDCVAKVNNQPPPPPPVVTTDKPIDLSAIRLVNQNNPVCVKTPSLCVQTASDFKTVSWDLSANIASGAGVSGVTFSVDIAVVDNGSDTTPGSLNLSHAYAFLITNPTITDKNTSNVHVAGVNFKINAYQAYDGTTFSVVDAIVGSGVTKNLGLYTADNGLSTVTNSGTLLYVIGPTLAASYNITTMFNVLQTTTSAPTP